MLHCVSMIWPDLADLEQKALGQGHKALMPPPAKSIFIMGGGSH